MDTKNTIGKFLISLTLLCLLTACSENENTPITFKLTYTFNSESASDNEDTSFVIVYDDEGNDINSQGSDLGRLTGIASGETKSVDVIIEYASVLELTALTKDGFKSVFTDSKVTDGSHVTWDSAENIARVTGNSNNNNPLIGKWYQTPQSCSNSSGERNFLHFKSNGTLTVFQADCNSACSGGGVSIYMDYEISGNKIIHTPKSVSEYCGNQAQTPSPFTVSYTISNGVLTIDNNQKWKK